MSRSCYPEGEGGDCAFRRIAGFIDINPASEYGFAHIVLSDDNLENDDLVWCLIWASKRDDDDPLDQMFYPHDLTPSESEELARCFLKWLLLIPEDVRFGERAEAEWLDEVRTSRYYVDFIKDIPAGLPDWTEQGNG